MDIAVLKYPAGQPNIPIEISSSDIEKWIETIAKFPNEVASLVKGLGEDELRLYRYRPGSWVIQQVINHCIDSHTNSIIRFKLALTEKTPVIKPYNETAWAELPDTLQYDINESLVLLRSIHKRWVFLLNSLDETDLKKTFKHPEYNEIFSLADTIYLYAWHCNNHLGHIKNAITYKFLT